MIFADETNLSISGINEDDLFSDMNSQLKGISFWFKANKLLLSSTKAKYSVFHPDSKKGFLRKSLPSILVKNE